MDMSLAARSETQKNFRMSPGGVSCANEEHELMSFSFYREGKFPFFSWSFGDRTNRKLTNDKDDKIGDGQGEKVIIGGRMHRLVMDDNEAYRYVSNYAHYKHKNVDNGHGDEPVVGNL